MTKAKNKIKITEHQHQVDVIQWAHLMLGKYPMLKWLYAIPNGAYLGADRRQRGITMNILKAEGLNTDVPDLCLPYPIYNENEYGYPDTKFHGLYIEMKSRDTKGKVRPGQQDWLDYLESAGYRVGTAWTSEEAIKIIEDYLNGN